MAPWPQNGRDQEVQCMSRFGMAVALFLTGTSQVFAGVVGVPLFATVPTLDEVGLVGLTIVVAIAGGIAARRRKSK